MSDTIHKLIEMSLNIIHGATGQWAGFHVDKRTPDIRKFRNIDLSPNLEVQEGRGDEYFFLVGKDCTPDVLWPIDVSIGMLRPDTDDYVVFRSRTTSAREWRGRATVISPYMMQRSIVELPQHGGRCMAATELYSYINGRWVDGTAKKIIRHHDDVRNALKPDFYDEIAQISISHALRQRYEWSVTIGEANGPSFRFATNAAGVRQLIEERDKPQSGRRDALRAWVTSHWRQLTSDPSSEVYVRRHLRGGETFFWRGYECSWSPSPFDIEQNQLLAIERKQMGSQAKRPR